MNIRISMMADPSMLDYPNKGGPLNAEVYK